MDEKQIYCELLVLRTKRGDPSAIEEIVRHWERQLFYYIRGLVGKEQDAWDVLQETWLRVVRDIGNCETRGRYPRGSIPSPGIRRSAICGLRVR